MNLSHIFLRMRSLWSAHRAVRVLVRTVLALGAVFIVAGTIWLFQLDRDIQDRFAQKRFASPVEFYSAPELIHAGEHYPAGHFADLFVRKSFVRREFSQSMKPGDYSIWTGEQCRSFLGQSLAPSATPEPALDKDLANSATSAAAPVATAAAIEECAVFVNRGAKNDDRAVTPSTAASASAPPAAPGPEAAPVAPANADGGQIIALDGSGWVIGTYDREGKHTLPQATIEPELFAQYYGDKPVLRQVVTFASGDVPPMCLNSLLAIEDAQFYEHPGVSVTGLLRSLLRDLRTGQAAQGGSTITQQLVKNYFLNPEKTAKRKLTEMAMAFLVEKHVSKDEILETYINLIYMGQTGPFEVRGFASASEHYFGKPLRDLELPECALLAAILNSPGFYDPATHPDHALKRRSLVIDRLLDLKFIDENQAKEAKAAPLPSRPPRSLTEPAPYFVQAVRREIDSRKIDTSEGLRVYTTMNLRAQEAAQQAVRAGLDKLETQVPRLKKIKDSGKTLEAVLISSDPGTGFIQALVGGRGFAATQYNRAIDSRRQVGSVMKPFVYLTALENLSPEGKPYTPLSTLNDRATTHKFDNQVWTPKNYEGIYNGDVPMYFALKESLNAATVNLGMSVGLGNIVESARRMGIESKIEPLPSLSLGAFELSPFEVLRAYGTMATLGQKTALSLIAKIEDLSGKEIYAFKPTPETVAAPDTMAELVGMMKQTLISGTGQSAKQYGFTNPAAGKTGTTNDKKDAWFAGFTPHHVAIVWVGYDDNTPHGLTGGIGAVPIWATYMNAYAQTQAPDDFTWPAGVEVDTIEPDQLRAFGVPEEGKVPLAPASLVFKKGQGPTTAPSPADH
jgi:penicillin-binding protein 1B